MATIITALLTYCIIAYMRDLGNISHYFEAPGLVAVAKDVKETIESPRNGFQDVGMQTEEVDRMVEVRRVRDGGMLREVEDAGPVVDSSDTMVWSLEKVD